MLIGICGLINSGKGAVGDILVEEHGFEKVSFADALKDAVAAIFGWEREMLEGVTEESRQWRETPDKFWSNYAQMQMTPRQVLQVMGTEVLRNNFHDDIWVGAALKRVVADPERDYVFPDTRFPNEIKMIRDNGGVVWQIRRGRDLPEWWDIAVRGNYERLRTEFPQVHQSEYRWVMPDKSFNKVIRNDGSMDDLRQAVAKIFATGKGVKPKQKKSVEKCLICREKVPVKKDAIRWIKYYDCGGCGLFGITQEAADDNAAWLRGLTDRHRAKFGEKLAAMRERGHGGEPPVFRTGHLGWDAD